MDRQHSSSDPLPEDLEFEGRFMSSHPITHNTFWWHHEQNAFEQQLPEFIPIHNDTAASHVPEHIATASSSSDASMNFLQTGISFREDVNGIAPTAVTTHSSDKRKSPESSWGESSAMASKRSVQIAGSSDAHAVSSSHTSCGDIYGPGSLRTLSFETLPPPRNSVFNSSQPVAARSDYNGRVSNIARIDTSLQGSPPANFSLSRTVISHNSSNVVQRPLLDLLSPQAVGEGSNVQNQPVSVECPVTLHQGVNYTRHQNGPRNISSNSSEPDFVIRTSQMEENEMVFRNSTQSLQLPVIVPPIGQTNLAHIMMDFSGGSSSIPLDDNLRASASSSRRRRRLELIRQALLEVDSFSGISTISDPGDNLGFTPETSQRFISRARHFINMYREGRDASVLEDGGSARHSLFAALTSIHDQHREMRLDVDNMSYEELLDLGERIGDVKTGLSEETIMSSLKHTEYTLVMKSNQPNVEPCSICQEEYAEGEDMGTLDCGHEYHTNCIKQWLVLKNSCPICKAVASSSSK